MKTGIFAVAVAVVATGATSPAFGVFYANDFATRRTSDATPSGRWMEADYASGWLARSVSSISSEGREPYNTSTEYQDGWTMKTGYCRNEVLFTVAGDSSNQGALVNAKSGTTSYQSATIAMQPFYNEFTNGVLKISVDIRTPALSTSFNPSGTACATFVPFYRSILETTSSTFAAPMHFGPANMQDANQVWHLCAVTRGRAAANSPSGSYFGPGDSRNDITAGSWVRYVAEINLGAGTYKARFADLGTEHPTPDTEVGSSVDFRQVDGDDNSTTFAFLDPLTPETGGIAGLAFYVQGIKYASNVANAPMYDNLAVYWKASSEEEEYTLVYENDFSTRRYRQVEPAGTTSGTYSPVVTTNVVQSSFYDCGQGSSDYGVTESDARRLVPDGEPYVGQDGWRRIAGGAYFKMVDPNKDGGYKWNNASVLRVTGSGKTGMIAVPLGATVSSGKVRLYCDILMGAITNSTDVTRDIAAAAFLAGDGAFTNAWYDAAAIRATNIVAALRNKGVCGVGTCLPGMEPNSDKQTRTQIYRFDGSDYLAQKDADGDNAFINCGKWGRFIVTLDLDTGTYDLAVYDLGFVGQTMTYDHSESAKLVEAHNLVLAASAICNVDSVVLFSDGQAKYNGGTETFNGKSLGRFPLFDNVRVCLVNADGSEGAELYACNFEYGYRLTVKNAASLAGPSDREGADRWIRRGNTYGMIDAVDAGDGDNVVVLDGLGYVKDGVNSGFTRTGYAVQPFGATTKGYDTVDLAADIRPPECFVRSSGCFTFVEIGGDAYAQGVYRPKSKSNWRYEPRIGFGFSVGAGYNDVKQYTNVVLTVQTVAAKGAEATSTTSDFAIDTSHWYRFRVKAKQKDGKFTVRVYDRGVANSADGVLVATFEDLELPSFGDEGMTTFGIAGAGFCGFSGGGIDDPNVALVDNLSMSAGEPITIIDREGLVAIADDFAGVYELGADINLSDDDWTPIGSESAPFTGTFRGNGRKITGLRIDAGGDYAGLFGVVSNATIEGVSVSGRVAGCKRVGGLVGCVAGKTVISNCAAAVEVVADEYTGGFVGYVGGNGVEISGCRADGYASGTGNVGGFVGYIGGTGNVTVTNCAARGDVHATYTNYGGFIGWTDDPYATNVNCWCSGAVWGKGGNSGSFVGLSLRGTNLNCGVYAYSPGPRYFSGSQTNYPFASLTAADLSVLTNGWPNVPKRAKSAAMTPISSPEELRAVANDPSGCYVLTSDIELHGQPFEPIGNVETPFTGEFYGQHHKITGFVVNTTNQYAGLFGVIAGGRVNGVRVDEGNVTGSYQGSSWDTGVGGFAGKITAKSMVDDCSFMGSVKKSRPGGNIGNIGGFVGRTDDSPTILRCCARDIGVENESRLPNTGGFVGNHAYGYIVDAYAVAGETVSSYGNYVGGFAGFVGPSARIATSWCNGLVSSSGQYVGAFVGDVNGGDLVTDSYYSTYPNGEDMKAKGTGGVGIGSSTAYAGITPLNNDEMGLQSSFQGFDFGPIWMMDEQAATPTPILRTIFSSCELWQKDRGVPDEYDPDEDLNGIPAGVRYVFDIDPEIGPDELAEPLIDIMFDADGKPYVKLPIPVNTEGATVSVLATEDLTDWSNAVEYQVDPATGICAPDFDPVPPKMFFKYGIEVDDN